MNTISTTPTLPSADINMHIGPVFDPERYLEMERQLFKEEPRPIPSLGRSVAQAQAKKTMLGDFIDAATKFSCWLDDILKAPFRALSRKTASASTSEAENDGAEMPVVNPDREIASPPKVIHMKSLESRRHPCKRVSLTIPEKEAPQANKKYQSLREELPGVRVGHVKHLIKRYEDWSDITREGSVEHSTKKSLTSKPWANENDHSGMTNSFSGATQGRVVANHPTARKNVTQVVVPKPAKVAASAAIVAETKVNSSDIISYGASREEEEEAPVGDTNNRRSRRNGARRNASNRGRGHRSVWVKFCGMRGGGIGTS